METSERVEGRVANKIALVTGAASGIGRATAILLANQGATVLVADIDEEPSRVVVESIREVGGRAEPMVLDVAEESAWQRSIERVVATHTRLDILVNNAGITLAKSVTEASFQDWRRVLSVNLDGVFLGTKYALAAMTKSRGGSIVNVASVSGIKPSPGASAYCTSKAAIRMFSKTVALECANAQTGIRVNLVTPGGVKTPLWEKEAFFQTMIAEQGGTEEAFAALSGGVPSQEFHSAEEVAQTILYLASDESAHLTGTETVMDRGQTG